VKHEKTNEAPLSQEPRDWIPANDKRQHYAAHIEDNIDPDNGIIMLRV
jgi:hypothetical protein